MHNYIYFVNYVRKSEIHGKGIKFPCSLVAPLFFNFLPFFFRGVSGTHSVTVWRTVTCLIPRTNTQLSEHSHSHFFDLCHAVFSRHDIGHGLVRVIFHRDSPHSSLFRVFAAGERTSAGKTGSFPRLVAFGFTALFLGPQFFAFIFFKEQEIKVETSVANSL